MTLAIIVGLAVIALVVIIAKALWNSKLFWFAMLALSIALIPATGGLSPIVLFLILLFRFFVIHKALTAGEAK